ncbi:hypothetical protein [Gracilimonas sp.]|uniref:hypothetical protein n=1 Tax=Gracilimonas sp. TaxID=1974203 RepID=UPI0028710C79|nr:hypothetical protein [Gracilimonas sp.]
MDKNNAVREELAEWISKPGNEDLFETLKLIKETETSGNDWYEDLTGPDKESITKGQKDHKEGRTLSSQEFWNENG